MGKRLDESKMVAVRDRGNDETVADACKRVGVVVSSFYSWQSRYNRQVKKRKRIANKVTQKPTMTEFPLPKVERKGFLFIGTPEFLASVAGQFQ